MAFRQLWIRPSRCFVFHLNFGFRWICWNYGFRWICSKWPHFPENSERKTETFSENKISVKRKVENFPWKGTQKLFCKTDFLWKRKTIFSGKRKSGKFSGKRKTENVPENGKQKMFRKTENFPEKLKMSFPETGKQFFRKWPSLVSGATNLGFFLIYNVLSNKSSPITRLRWYQVMFHSQTGVLKVI